MIATELSRVIRLNYIAIKELLKHQLIDDELNSFQIIAILLALENFAGLNDFGIKTYQGWISSRKKRQPFQSTINLAILARSFEINGFSEEFPLEVDPDDFLLNGGTHRTACSLFYGIEKTPIVFRSRTGASKEKPKYYGVEYFKKSDCFTDALVTKMEKRWDDIVEGLGILK